VTDTFFERLERRVEAVGSLLCVGLDPRAMSPVETREWCQRIVSATAPFAAAFKPNSAFFEAMGPAGLEALIEVVAAIPDEIPVLLDAKRGDIASSAEAYATAVFGQVGADAVTISPYLGADSVEPFLAGKGSGVFVLCRTSNPGAAEIQEQELASGEPLFEAVARNVARWPADRVGLVVGATAPDALKRVRAVAPDHWILAPGVGAQGGSLSDALAAGLRTDASGMLIPVSRAIAEAADPAGAAEDLKTEMASGRVGSHRPAASEPDLARSLLEARCIQFGDFELKSGVRSPVYLDLRNLAGDPALLRRVAASYLPLLDDVDRVAGVPLGGLPIATAVSLTSGIPMVYARPSAKDHGTRSAIEGPFVVGDSAVAIDDVVTSGISISESVGRLREGGIVVDTAVVLVDRGGGAAAALAHDGITLRSVTTLHDIVGSLAAQDLIDEVTLQRVTAFLDS
jgi:uridine monophosphate synthetase